MEYRDRLECMALWVQDRYAYEDFQSLEDEDSSKLVDLFGQAAGACST